MAHSGGPTFDPQAAISARQRTQRRRAIGAFAIIVAGATAALIAQGRRSRNQPPQNVSTSSISEQLHQWAVTHQPTPREPDAVAGLDGDAYERAEADVERAEKARATAQTAIERAAAEGVDRRRLETLRARLQQAPAARPEAGGSERAL